MRNILKSICLLSFLTLIFCSISCGGSSATGTDDSLGNQNPTPPGTGEPIGTGEDEDENSNVGNGLNGANEVSGVVKTSDGSVIAGATVYIPASGSSNLDKSISVGGITCDEPTELACAATCTDEDGSFTLDVTACDENLTEIIIQKDGIHITIILNCSGEDSCDLGSLVFTNNETENEEDDQTAGVTYSIGGSVSGIDIGDLLVLQNNGLNDITITKNGEFVFLQEIPDGGNYKVTILTSPNHKTCTVTNGVGTISEADIFDINVVCLSQTETQWERSIAGPGRSLFRAVSADLAGNIYAVGRITGTGAYNFGNNVMARGTYVTGYSVVLVKYNTYGDAQWAKSVTSVTPNLSEYLGVSVGADGDIYAVGRLVGTGVYNFGDGKTIGGVYAGDNVVIVKYDSNGVVQWVKSCSGEQNAYFSGVSSGSDGSIYAIGFINGSKEFDFGDGVTVRGSSSDSRNVVIVKYNSAGVAQWAKSVATGQDSYFNGVSVDVDGNIYAVGNIYGTVVYDFGDGVTIRGVSVGDYSAVVVKYNSSGNVQWVKLGGGGVSFNGVSIASDGSIYVVGRINGTSIYDFGNGVTVTGHSTGGYGIVIVKYNPTGVAQWAKSAMIGSSNSEFLGVSVGADGSIYAVGYFIGTGGYNFGSDVRVSGTHSGENALIVNYSLYGYAQWARTINGAQDSRFYGVSAGFAGNIFAAGFITGNEIYDFGDRVTVNGAVPDSHSTVLVKYGSDTIAKWARSVVATDGDSYFEGVATGTDGSIYAVGRIYGTISYDFGNGITVRGDNTNINAVIVKYDSSGIAQWAKSVTTGPNNSIFNGVSVSTDDSIYAVGFISGKNEYDFEDDVTVGCTHCTDENAGQIVIVKYSADGHTQWAKSVTTSPNSFFYSVSTDAGGNVYAVGNVYGKDVSDFGNGVTVNYTKLYNNVVIVKYNSSGATQWAKSITAGESSSFYGVSTSIDGSVYAVGYIVGTGGYNFGNGVTVNGANINANTVVVKYNSDGNAQWARSVITANSNDSYFRGISSDSYGNIYAVGHIYGAEVLNFGNAVTIKGTYASGYSVVLVKYNSSGVAQWARSMIDGPSYSIFNGVSVDANDSIYAVGGIESGIYDFGNGNTVSGPGGIVIVKYDTYGTVQGTKSVIYGDGSSFSGVATDLNDNIYAVGVISYNGEFDFGDGIAINGAYTGTNVLIVKYPSEGF